MKVKNKKPAGFTLLLVVSFIGIIAVEAILLAAISHSLFSQTNDIYLTASRENLKASALAWAKVNIQKENTENLGKEIKLDLSEFKNKRSNLRITIKSLSQKKAKVEISASCSWARQTKKSAEQYQIELPSSTQ